MSLWRLRLFGEVSLDGQGLEVRNFGTVRAAKLLVILSLTRSARMPREHLAEHLWPDDLYDATRLRLRQEIHRLKKALGPAEGMVVTTTNDVGLDRAFFETDIDILKKLVQNQGEAKEGLEIEPLFKNEFLPAWDEVWTMAERAPAEALQLQAAIAYGQSQLSLGKPEQALEVAQWMIPKHPYNEELRMVAVKAYGDMGSLASAVAEYQRFRRGLKEALGVEPGDDAERMLKELTEAHGHSPEPVQAATRSDSSPVERSSAAELIGEIPNPIEPMIGRQELFNKVFDLLNPQNGVRLLTLVGPGGIGKTRLAIELAHSVKQQGGRRVLFATLAESASTSDWARVILTQLKSALPSDSDPIIFLSNLLKTEPTLLILDNAEPFLPEISLGVKRLLESAPHLSVLVTSITPLKLGGEAPITVGPLDPMTEGKLMLMNALRTHRPLAAAVAANDSALDQIAARLDGYPLALRLAAARFRLLSPSALLQTLDSIASLSGSAPDLPERHRSLDSALAASFAALDETEKSALRALCALPGGAGMELAGLIITNESHLEVLERLLDSALVTLDDLGTHVRFRILSPVRFFVKDSVPSFEWQICLQSAARASADYVRNTKITPESLPNQTQLDLLDEEVENIQAAWNWAIDEDRPLAIELANLLCNYEMARGRPRQTLAKLKALESEWMHEDMRIRAQIFLSLGALYMLAGELDLAPAALTCAEEASDALDCPIIKARTALAKAGYAMRRQYWSSKDLALEALALAQASGVEDLIARADHLLGAINFYANDRETALAHMIRAYDAYRLLDTRGLAGTTGLILASYHLFRGETREAEKFLAASKVLLLNSGDPVSAAHSFEIEGRMLLADGRAAEAETLFRESLRIWQTVGSPFQEADQQLSLTRSMLAQERWSEASQTLLQSADNWVQDLNSGGLCQSISSLAVLLHQIGKNREAKDALAYSIQFQEAEALIIVEPEIAFRSSVIALVGGVGDAQGPYNLTEARKLFDQLL